MEWNNEKNNQALKSCGANLLAACSNQAAPAELRKQLAQATTGLATTQAPATTATNTTVATNASGRCNGKPNEFKKKL